SGTGARRNARPAAGGNAAGKGTRARTAGRRWPWSGTPCAGGTTACSTGRATSRSRVRTGAARRRGGHGPRPPGGAKGLAQNFEALFPRAIFPLDVRHVEEKLCGVGHLSHREGGEELRASVGAPNGLPYQGRVEALLGRLREQLRGSTARAGGRKRR